ncbi:MAG: cellulase family glycosylhydrolase [Chloroflexota bacterium]
MARRKTLRALTSRLAVLLVAALLLTPSAPDVTAQTAAPERRPAPPAAPVAGDATLPERNASPPPDGGGASGDPPSTAPPPRRGGPPETRRRLKGVALDLNGTPDDARQFDLARQIGADVFRNTLSWDQLEPVQKGRFSTRYLGVIDAFVNQAEQRGIKPVFGLAGSPCWASADPNKNCGAGQYKFWYPPTHPVDYGDALRVLTQRYGSRVLAWEVWNEPNLKEFWGGANPDPQKYVLMVKAARAASPDAFILAGALSSSVSEYLVQLYDAGLLAEDYNAVSMHPYVWMDPAPGGGPEDCDYMPMSFLCGVPNIHAIMQSRGDSRGEIWFTEFGWSSKLVGDSTQAGYLRRAFQIASTWSYVPVAMWFLAIDDALNDFRCCFGLFRADGTAKPAAQEFHAAALP